MIERYFSQAKVLIRLRSGSVGPCLPALRERCGAEPVPTGYQKPWLGRGNQQARLRCHRIALRPKGSLEDL
jgi:hypothetical protein